MNIFGSSQRLKKRLLLEIFSGVQGLKLAEHLWHGVSFVAASTASRKCVFPNQNAAWNARLDSVLIFRLVIVRDCLKVGAK